MYSEIDELIRRDHYYLGPDDECYFEGEYTPRGPGGYSYSDTNSFISNLKKPVDRRDRPEWIHKTRAIERAAGSIREGFHKDWLQSVTLVPSPPSKMPTDPEYDDRIFQVLKQIEPSWNLDIREIIVQTQNRVAMHLAPRRYTPDQLMVMWQIDEELANPPPSSFAFIDDVLTSGTHFKAAKRILQRRFGPVPVVGIFLARVARPSDDIDIDDLFAFFDDK